MKQEFRCLNVVLCDRMPAVRWNLRLFWIETWCLSSRSRCARRSLVFVFRPRDKNRISNRLARQWAILAVQCLWLRLRFSVRCPRTWSAKIRRSRGAVALAVCFWRHCADLNTWNVYRLDETLSICLCMCTQWYDFTWLHFLPPPPVLEFV